MSLTRRLGSAALGLAIAVTACSPALDWRQARPEGAAVTVLLPCKPERRSREMVLAQAPSDVEVLSCSAAGTTWAVTSTEAGAPERAAAVLAALRAARTVNLQGQEIESRQVRIDIGSAPLPALRLRVEGRLPQGEAIAEHSLLFAYGSRAFHVAALSGSPSAEALETFFDGIEAAR